MRDKIYISQFPDGGAWDRAREREQKTYFEKNKTGIIK